MLSVISSSFNESDNIVEFTERVLDALKRSSESSYELILIDNCSTDGTRQKIRELASRYPQVKAIFNARNFGHIRSPYHALMQASGDAVVCMSSDLQDPPEIIPQLVNEWKSGYKAVVCVKETSEESRLLFLLRKTYYALAARLSDTRLIQNFTGFGLYDRSIVEYCRKLENPYPYFRGLISEIGLPVKELTYRQPNRKGGVTKNNFYTLYDLAMLGITSHSKVPLRLATMAGFITSILSLVVGMAYLIYKLLFWQQFAAGTAPLVIGLFFFASVQLFFIGILGEYIGSIHTQVHKRPLVVEQERLNF